MLTKYLKKLVSVLRRPLSITFHQKTYITLGVRVIRYRNKNVILFKMFEATLQMISYQYVSQTM